MDLLQQLEENARNTIQNEIDQAKEKLLAPIENSIKQAQQTISSAQQVVSRADQASKDVNNLSNFTDSLKKNSWLFVAVVIGLIFIASKLFKRGGR